METVVWIIVVIAWLIISGISKNKKEQEKQKQRRSQQPLPPETNPETKQPETFKEIFEEMRRQFTEVEQEPEKQPEFPTIKTITEQKKNQADKLRKPITNKQIVIEDREIISEQEKQSAIEYRKFVEQARRKEHDAVHHDLDKKVMQVTEEVEYEPLQIDLKNIIIADALMRRPEY